ncbi:Flp family type IVb pilin [Tsuneonella amylolytica]|uniref:Flp family type IVb pilin n=1 Tax=Tsuneonella amylolytica TaxID=2338327 RepID=UPI001F34725B|nr:Flp family type IVb pilin [Tsuneonella amylolytica]
MPMRKLIRAIASDISGATAVEYGLILSLIFLAMVAAIQNFGNVTTNMWNDTADKMQKATTK